MKINSHPASSFALQAASFHTKKRKYCIRHENFGPITSMVDKVKMLNEARAIFIQHFALSSLNTTSSVLVVINDYLGFNKKQFQAAKKITFSPIFRAYLHLDNKIFT